MASNNDNYYFDGFIEQAEFSYQIVEKLNYIFANYEKINLRTAMDELHLLEHTADIKHHEIMEKLSKEFLPPIEREDIANLTQQLDDLTDYLEDILILLYTYHVDGVNETILQMMEIIDKSVSQLIKMLTIFRNYKHDRTIYKYIIEINRLEENGDILFHEFMHKVFEEEHDARYLISQKEVFTKLEEILDTAEDIANEVANIMMKNP